MRTGVSASFGGLLGGCWILVPGRVGGGWSEEEISKRSFFFSFFSLGDFWTTTSPFVLWPDISLSVFLYLPYRPVFLSLVFPNHLCLISFWYIPTTLFFHLFFGSLCSIMLSLLWPFCLFPVTRFLGDPWLSDRFACPASEIDKRKLEIYPPLSLSSPRFM